MDLSQWATTISAVSASVSVVLALSVALVAMCVPERKQSHVIRVLDRMVELARVVTRTAGPSRDSGRAE